MLAALPTLPLWLAEAIAVPAAAQLACTPVVVALSGQGLPIATKAMKLLLSLLGTVHPGQEPHTDTAF